MSNFRQEINVLLSGIKSGEILKQKVLFDATYNHLTGIAYKYAIDKNDVEDILLESYIKAFKYIKSFDVTKDGYNWLCKIVQNVAYDYNNKLQLFADLDLSVNSEFFNKASIEDKNALTVEISKLSQYEQELIYLRFWENLSYSEIADKVNGKKSTIHKQISIIIKILYKNLKD